MKLIKLIGVLMMAVLLLGVTACGGGGDDNEDIVPTPNPGDTGIGGDPDVPVIVGQTAGQFTLPGGSFGDLRGVAASQEYVYVADTTTLYAFDKNGNFVNAAAAPGVVQAVAVFPPTPDLDLAGDDGYFLSGFPAILCTPYGTGYIRIYGPNLDVFTTREDQSHSDAQKYIDLPGGQMHPPNQLAWCQCLTTYDMAIDRFGSILVIADIDAKCTNPSPDWPRALQILNRFNGFAIEYSGPATCVPPDWLYGPDGDPMFDDNDDYATGDMGTIAVDVFFPFNRTEKTYTWYTGHFNLLRDFVGVSSITLDTNTSPPSYNVGMMVDNAFGYTRVIGETVGSAFGSFNQNPPVNPGTGALEDPDLTNGGPSGMNSDPLTDDILICDPGNRRIQRFDQTSGAFLRTYGDGTRGVAGDSFIAPSSVTVDYEGNIFVCDVNMLRVLREGGDPDRQYGSVGGTVRRGDTSAILPGATVNVGNELGTLALRTTDINGQYLIQSLPVGTYYLTASKFNYDSDSTDVQIIADTTVVASFNLMPREPATTGSLTGNIIDSFTNLYLPDVTVTLVGTSLTATTDDLGRFLITSIAPGTYQVVFTKDGYDTITLDIEILSGSVTTNPLLQMDPE
ncbi:MAG: carboxypeptidase regulatory-like domain-containing protein [Anaerolineae bacterium]|nr:carboxypeptidase regulatory-like domain-containing protein [Anaerolineae bacterium]